MNELTELQNHAVKFRLNFKKELLDKVINLLKNYFGDNFIKIGNYSSDYRINGIIVDIYVFDNYDINFKINNTFTINLTDYEDIDLILELIDKKINKVLLQHNVLNGDK